MSRLIQVDPQNLRASAQRLSALVEALSLQRDQILKSAAGAPSYDGQFGPQVNALAADAAAQVHSRFTRLGELARELEAIAELFETADAETLQAIEGIGIQIESEIAGFMALLARLHPPGGPPPPLRLDLTLEEFQAMSAAERIAWVESFNEGTGAGWFSNFEDILHYFNDSQIFSGLDGSTPASLWMSWGDAAVLQVVQDGYALFRDPDAKLPDMPAAPSTATADQRLAAARLWADFFDANETDPRRLPTLRRIWGEAEQAGVDYGQALADDQLELKSIQLSQSEAEIVEVFVGFGDAYRTTIANDAGRAVFEAAPGAFVGEVAHQVAQEVQGSVQEEVRQRLEPAGGLFELFTGQPGNLLIDQVCGVLFGEDTLIGQTDEVAETFGEWAGDRMATRLEPQLGDLGDQFFDPRLRLGIAVEFASPVGEVELDIGVRGPLYHLSMTVEEMLLRGDGDLANSFLDSVQAAVEEALGR